MSSLLNNASWIVISKETGAAIFETFSKDVADKVNLEKYIVLGALAYLQGLNK